jgi:glycosyltransferase involved in cell wall biosynthesis
VTTLFETAIRVEELSKQYRLGARQASYNTLRDTVAALLRWALRTTSPRFAPSAGGRFWALKDVSFDRGNPLVSVVIPAYNRAATITAALESVQEQTYRHWEAITVDDGSRDETAAIVVAMAARDSRIRLVREGRNRGAQAARNSGIRAARGEWICFLDSDDQFLPESIERLLRVAAQENVSVVHAECYVRDKEDEIRRYFVPPTRGDCYRELLRREGPMFTGLLVRREALERIALLDDEILAFQEWDTAIRLSKHFAFGFEPEPTFVYDCRTPVTISNDPLRVARGYEQVLRKHFLSILGRVGPRVVAFHYRTAARCYENGKDSRAARRCLRAAMFWSLLDPRTIIAKVHVARARRSA